MTRYEKETYVCDRKDCGAVYERIVLEGRYGLPDGWSQHEKKHYCAKHRLVISLLDVVGEKGQWTQEK